MANVTVIGAQWGDEGKGKIVDWLASRADAVVRFQGGHNAGHTLVIDGTTYKLSLLPSGIVSGTLSVIGNGVVLDPWALKAEIEKLEAQGVTINDDNLAVADNCPLILPIHRDLDGLREAAAGSGKIGTTGRGIGPAYEDKVGRRAIRVCDLAHLDALEPQLSRYGYRLDRPLDNKYGMAFATRLTVDRAEMVANTSSNTPTLYATLRMGDGARFEMIGLHPRPPLPGQSTESRDANIAQAGARTPDGLSNVLAIADFNDVPWSNTTSRFVAEGGYRDPRAGRGSFATFPADYAWIGWPLDQIFVKDGVKVEELEIGEDVGSDHLPLIAKVCVDPMSADADIEGLFAPDTAPAGEL